MATPPKAKTTIPDTRIAPPRITTDTNPDTKNAGPTTRQTQTQDDKPKTAATDDINVRGVWLTPYQYEQWEIRMNSAYEQ
jgi:hypothetical protein